MMTRGRKVTMEEEKTKEKMVEDDKQQLVIEPTPEPVQPFCELIEEEEEKEDEQMRQTPIILSEREIIEKEKKKKMKKGKRKKKKMRKMRKMKKKKREKKRREKARVSVLERKRKKQLQLKGHKYHILWYLLGKTKKDI